MDEDAFNMSTRKFLKKLGVTAQREIEQRLREQVESGALKGNETIDVKATVTIDGVSQEIVVPGRINLGG